MSEELVKRETDSIIEFTDNKDFVQIITRAADENLFEFQSIGKAEIAQIASFMTEVNRATNAFGKSQSQYMNHIMTVSNNSVYRNLRQILSEIERKRQALKENTFKLKRDIITLIQKRELVQKEQEKYAKLMLEVDIEELESNITDARLYVEAALKTILAYEGAYNDIKSKYNIDRWDEKDFELSEEEHHIKKAFEQAHADILSTSRINQGNHEYFRQVGINPQNAFADLTTYMAREDKRMTEMVSAGDPNPNIGIESFVQFLDDMATKYRGCSAKVLALKGINPNGHYDNSLFKDLDNNG